MSDGYLLSRAVDGDREAVESIVERYRAAVYGVALSFLRNVEDAEDVTQETFSRAISSFSSIREPEKLGSWLCGVAKNQSLRWISHNRTRSKLVEGPVREQLLGRAIPPLDAVEEKALREEVFRGIYELPEVQRVTTVLYYVGGYTMREVASFLDKPLGTVKRRLSDARKRLRVGLSDSLAEYLPLTVPKVDTYGGEGVIKYIDDSYAAIDFESHLEGALDLIRPEHRILDAGCGTGAITRFLAGKVHRGEVVGIDNQPKMIERAGSVDNRELRGNVRFQCADVYDIPFPARHFDIVFSNMLLGSLRQPVAGVREQLRVTKPGGRIIAYVADFASKTFHPACPAFVKVYNAFERMYELSNLEGAVSMMAGRRAYGVFTEAGLLDIRVATHRNRIFTAGSPALKARAHQFCSFFLDSEGPLREIFADAFAAGLLSDNHIVKAKQEIERWRSHPHAFLFEPGSFFVTGVVR